jgi:hypothetical protein
VKKWKIVLISGKITGKSGKFFIDVLWTAIKTGHLLYLRRKKECYEYYCGNT